MTPRPLLALALAVAACSAAGAHADPVTQSRRAETRVQLDLGRGRTLDLALGLTSGRLRVEATACDADGCDTPETWAGPVTGATVDDSRAAARLRTTLAGQPLAVTWTPSDQSGVVLQGLDASGGPHGETAAAYKGDPADAVVTLDGRTCTAAGSVGDEIRVSDDAAEGAAPLSEMELPTGELRC